VEHVHHAIRAIDPEQDPIHVPGTPVVEHTHRTPGVGTLRREWTPLGMLIERKNGVLEAIEPCCALVWSAPRHPQEEGLEVGFRALRQLNAECHASVGAD
jgi:hypothetical protein